MATDLTALDAALGVSLAVATQKGLDLSTPGDTLNLSKNLQLAFGTGAGKANQVFHDRRVLAGGASEDLDLAGTLTNWAGQIVTFSKVKLILLMNRSDEVIAGIHPSATDAEIAASGPAVNGFQGPFLALGDGIKVPAGGVFVIATKDANGWAVTAGTGDLLHVNNEDPADQACYDVVIVGESA